jgi:hypothetical protein
LSEISELKYLLAEKDNELASEDIISSKKIISKNSMELTNLMEKLRENDKPPERYAESMKYLITKNKEYESQVNNLKLKSNAQLCQIDQLSSIKANLENDHLKRQLLEAASENETLSKSLLHLSAMEKARSSSRLILGSQICLLSSDNEEVEDRRDNGVILTLFKLME